MKFIPCKTVEVTLDGKPTRISYKAQLREIMRVPSDPRGADLEEVRRSLRVLDALDTEDVVLKLEDADFEYMVKRVRGARWQVIDKFVMAFIEDVTNARE
jgi:hypothetical protein